MTEDTQPQAEPSSATVPSDEQIDAITAKTLGLELRRDLARVFARAVLALAAPAVQPEPKQSGIPVEAGIAWQAGAFSTERKAVTVEGHAWYRHDHPSVKPAAQSADAVDAMHRAIMNIPCEPLTGLAFRLGHRAARHAAAEIVLSQSAAAAKDPR